jgi:mannose-6-phosphate isomerase-like protein (cupin superfamily)
MQEIQSINIAEKFSLFEKLWTPHIIGELNGQYVKLCKLKDDFVWHSHEKEDELFMVFKGTLLMDFRDGRTVAVRGRRNSHCSERGGTPPAYQRRNCF